jgi:hypothetical protein
MRLILLLICACFCSCAVVKNQVTAFHSLPPKGQNETFMVVVPPAAPQLQDRLYAQRIAQHLAKYGWKEAKEAPDFTVTFDYSVSNPFTASASVPVMGQTGGGTSFHTGTVTSTSGSGSFTGTSYTPATFGVVGSTAFSQTAFERNLRIVIKNRSGQEVLDARSKSVGTRSDINVVMPIMIDTIFADFPGKSGRTETYHRTRELK